MARGGGAAVSADDDGGGGSSSSSKRPRASHAARRRNRCLEEVFLGPSLCLPYLHFGRFWEQEPRAEPAGADRGAGQEPSSEPAAGALGKVSALFRSSRRSSQPPRKSDGEAASGTSLRRQKAFIGRVLGWSEQQEDEEEPEEEQEPTLAEVAKEAFGQADVDSSGVLSRREVEVVLRILGVDASEAVPEGATEDSLLELDEGGFRELLLSVEDKADRSATDLIDVLTMLRRTFGKMDLDGDGTLSVREISSAVRAMGGSQDEVLQLVSILDTDGSGNISWVEFVDGMVTNMRREENGETTESCFQTMQLAISNAALPTYMKDQRKKAHKEGIKDEDTEVQEAWKELAILERLALWVAGKKHAPNEWRTTCWQAVKGEFAGFREARSPMDSTESPDRMRSTASINSCSTTQSFNDAQAEREVELSESKMQAVTRIVRCVIFKSCLVGALAGILGSLSAWGVDWLFFADTVSGVDRTFEEEVLFYCLIGVTGMFWSTIEIVIMYYSCLLGAVDMTEKCGLKLWPANKERALILGSLARAALEVPHPLTTRMGVDPLKKKSKAGILVVGALYLGKRAITKFLLKMLLKKVLPRAGIKGLGSVLDVGWGDMVLSVLVNVGWNYFTVREALREVRICCIGPAAVVKIMTGLLREFWKNQVHEGGRLKPMRKECKVMILRAVGVMVMIKGNFHPNTRHLMTYLCSLILDEGRDEALLQSLQPFMEGDGGSPKAEQAAPAAAEAPPAEANESASGGRRWLGLLQPSSFSSYDSPAKSDSQGSLKRQTSGESSAASPLAVTVVTGRFQALIQAPPTERVAEQNKKLEGLSLDDEEMFLGGLKALNQSETTLVLSTLTVAAVVDGDKRCWLWWRSLPFLRKAFAAAKPPRECDWKEVKDIANRFAHGQEIRPESVHAAVGAPAIGGSPRSSTRPSPKASEPHHPSSHKYRAEGGGNGHASEFLGKE